MRNKTFIILKNNQVITIINIYKIIFILFLITAFIIIKIELFNPYNEIYSRLFFVKGESDYIPNDKTLNDYIINIKNHNFDEQCNSSCYPTKNKLFWKNEKDLQIIRLQKEIKTSNLSQISFKDIRHFYKRECPKISIIITVYNQGHYLKTLYSFIQKQELEDIEIIFIDDSSNDNSSFIIKELLEFDKRIIYLKNIKNKRQFYSIYMGIFHSKGEYILSIDPEI